MVIGRVERCRDACRGRAGCGRPPRRSRCRRRTSRTCRSEGASGIAPSSEMRPCVVRSPISPQKLAGARIEPPVSEPTAMSASLPATAAAEPRRRAAGDAVGRGGVHRRREMRVDAHQREGELVGLRLAGEARALVEQQLDRRHGAVRRSCASAELVGIAAAGAVAGDVENVLDAELQARRAGPIAHEATGTCGRSRKALRRSRVPVIVQSLDTMSAPLFDARIFSTWHTILIDCEGRCPYIALAQSRTCLWASADPRMARISVRYPGSNPSGRFSGQPQDRGHLEATTVRAFLVLCRLSIDRGY